MEYQEVLQNARTCMGPYCKACPVCNGQACKNTIPGPGAKGSGTGFARNYQKWQELRVNLDTIGENRPADTSFDLFGHRLALPVMAAPVGAMQLHYGDKYDDLTYNRLLLAACAKAGIVAFTGDGVDPAVMEGATQAIRAQQGCGVPTVKPWDRETLMQKLELALTADPMAIAMDIDAAGLPFLRNRMPPAGSKTVAELREVAEYARKPFILKGIMTVRGAEKAVEAGASAIVVSNHGGRVLDQCPATAEVLPAIADAVGDRSWCWWTAASAQGWMCSRRWRWERTAFSSAVPSSPWSMAAARRAWQPTSASWRMSCRIPWPCAAPTA